MFGIDGLTIGATCLAVVIGCGVGFILGVTIYFAKRAFKILRS